MAGLRGHDRDLLADGRQAAVLIALPLFVVTHSLESLAMKTLFRKLLGSDFELLPEPVRRFHTLERERFTSGRSDVTAPKRSPGALLLSLVAGLPAPGLDVETRVRFSPLPQGREYWRRDFAGRRYQSVMEAARDGRLIEHFGPFDLFFDLAASPDGLHWSLSEWRLLRIPLPRFTKPTIECLESGEGLRFMFDIDVVFPIVGRVVHYSGALEEQQPARGTATAQAPCP
jgi:hypothetical protein